MANRDTRIDKCAARSGISRGHISRVLNGRRVPSFTVACKIADGMNIGLDALRREIEGRKAKGVPKELSDKISAGVKRSQAQARLGHNLTMGDNLINRPQVESVDPQAQV